MPTFCGNEEEQKKRTRDEKNPVKFDGSLLDHRGMHVLRLDLP